jgi:hypothetical protein
MQQSSRLQLALQHVLCGPLHGLCNGLGPLLLLSGRRLEDLLPSIHVRQLFTIPSVPAYGHQLGRVGTHQLAVVLL